MYNESRHLTSLFILVLVPVAAGATPLGSTHEGVSEPTAESLQEWGNEVMQQVQRDYWLDEAGLYAERFRARARGNRKPAFMWSAGVQLTALAAAARNDPHGYTTQLTNHIESLSSYWSTHDGIGGFNAVPNPTAADRFYDDNAWIVLALLEVFDLTGDPRYLSEAKKTLAFVLSGEDTLLGGGIYWRETAKETKNTCSNGPAIVGALEIYQRSQEPVYLETARRLYDWTCSRLQDPQDDLFWDNVSLEGKVDHRKYSYNTALMIRANCLFYEVTRESEYLIEAQRMAKSAAQRWCDSETGAVRDFGKFAHMLLEAFLCVHQLDKDRRWLTIIEKSLRCLHSRVRDPNGRYPPRWDAESTKELKSFELIDQASAARAYLISVPVFAPK